jgi:hypothetical protein
MKRLVLFAAVAAVILGKADVTAAAELPAFASAGLPITTIQAAVLEPAHVRELSPVPALTAGGMPASPHQIAVLTAHRKIVGELVLTPAARR